MSADTLAKAVDDHILNVFTDDVEMPQEDLYAGRFYRCTGRLPDGKVIASFRVRNRTSFYSGLEARVRCLPVFTPVRLHRINTGKYLAAIEDRKHVEESQAKGNVGTGKELSGASGTTRSAREVSRGRNL